MSRTIATQARKMLLAPLNKSSGALGIFRKEHFSLNWLPPTHRVPFLSFQLLQWFGWRSRPYDDPRPEAMFNTPILLGLVLEMAFPALFAVWLMNSGDVERLAYLGDGLRHVHPVVHSLLMLGLFLSSGGVALIYLYRTICVKRRDGFSRMFNFLFTRDTTQIIIHTDDLQAVKFWKVAYGSYLICISNSAYAAGLFILLLTQVHARFCH